MILVFRTGVFVLGSEVPIVDCLRFCFYWLLWLRHSDRDDKLRKILGPMQKSGGL